MMKKTIFLSACLLVTLVISQAQPGKENVRIVVTPDHDNWTYNRGETATFDITVLQYDVPIKNVKIFYQVMPEKMDPIKSDTLVLKKGTATIKAGTMHSAGFLRCRVTAYVNGKTYSDYTTVAYEPLKIEPTTTLPDDFMDFWNSAKAKLAEVPVEPLLTLLPEKCTPDLNVYHVRINNISGHIYGILAVPKKPGRYPAILHVPGAGIRPYSGDIANAEKGVITFQIGIHGIPVTMERYIYQDLGSGAVGRYYITNMDDRERYYYYRVYLGCVRAVDFIYTLDAFDGETVSVFGGSQGGALSIVTAGLDPRIKYLVSSYPALCDLTGYLHGRAGGWPHLFTDDFTNKDEKIETSRYYDVVNFARFVKAEGLYTWGYNDNVCPPTSTYAAYNVITAPKKLELFLDTRHWTYPEQREMRNRWIVEKLLKKY